MQNTFIDFEKLFEDFLRAKYKHTKEVNLQEVKQNLDKLYHEWSETTLESLGGKKPSEYFKFIDEPTQLIEYLVLSCENDKRPSSYLLDRISEVPSTVPLLENIVLNQNNQVLRFEALQLLRLMGAPQQLNKYVDILMDSFDNVEIRESIIEILIENASSVKEKIFSVLAEADYHLKTVFCEILINAEHDERTSLLLQELFFELRNVPLIAQYIGRYGDENMASILYQSLDTCNYFDYIEIKNAIERLGGIVDDVRDFTEDAYYRLIKNLD